MIYFFCRHWLLLEVFVYIFNWTHHSDRSSCLQNLDMHWVFVFTLLSDSITSYLYIAHFTYSYLSKLPAWAIQQDLFCCLLKRDSNHYYWSTRSGLLWTLPVVLWIKQTWYYVTYIFSNKRFTYLVIHELSKLAVKGCQWLAALIRSLHASLHKW